ncbi:transposase [Desulfosporosinus acidiphilus SJ4]|uniref:Transposase n=1 Tax=Desulfosporosinus acidiphilus (strain DSM 22704 / JCM 16185 / SJ4) TaxID=646529 RepID=H7DXE5_DESAJ|nr:IS1182 family transposase [Desulfosporosinus acidiphilus]AFM39258.1 transposase [Desulfosporosinus acidiphilus SJ4]AFM39329.1 transposase [Desulfosporosinus acidiphilus SJ4]AFM39615.1 transposase [Desulfosporosinus acidiphilus SJ4]AFM39745.1 transposase [Desulfosporosinus acidiphilus SJ4]AFM41363.1 transposase [Desulfosporosinus acidiphilus SJ4]
MLKTKLHTKNYNELGGHYQLALPFNFNVLIPEDDSVRLLSHILEGLNYEALYKAYSSTGRKPVVEPKILFKVLTYAYMNNIYSSRKIEVACKRDINFMWLLAGCKAPDHSTIARFRKDYLKEAIEDLFFQMVKHLHELGEVEFKNLFVDGTKIEASANRYTFVWKKVVNKNEAKMFLKIQSCLEEINLTYLKDFNVTKETLLKDLKTAISYLEEKCQQEQIEFVHGIGKRKSKLQKFIESLKEFYTRQEKYNAHHQFFEGRNSYSKTDPDATFMHMKDDHMRNAQLKPAYNVQIGVESEYVTGVGIFQDRNDIATLIPFLNMLESKLQAHYENVTADSGYESEENYLYLEGKHQTCYIKPQTYEQWKKKSFKKDISKRENMAYNAEIDEYTCHNGKQLKPVGITHRTSATGYQSEITVYECEDCSDCPCKSRCTKAKGNRRMQVSKTFVAKRQISYRNITTKEGILLRVNRSIQVEGAFGVLKNDYNFNRFLTRGKNSVKTEFMLLCFGYNVNKLHSKIQNERIGKPLHPLKTA